MSAPFTTPQAAAIALLNACSQGAIALTRKAGSFLGQLVADDMPMTPAQSDWLDKLLEKAGLPSFIDGGARG